MCFKLVNAFLCYRNKKRKNKYQKQTSNAVKNNNIEYKENTIKSSNNSKDTTNILN